MIFRSKTLPWLLLQPILGKIGKMPFIRQAGVPEQLKYGSFNSKVFNGNVVTRLYANIITIGGPVTPEIVRVTTAPFWTRRKKIGISHQMSRQLLDQSPPAYQHW